MTDWYLTPPMAGYIVAGIALVWSIIYAFLRNIFIDMDKREMLENEMRKFRYLYAEARKTGDPRLLNKLLKDKKKFEMIQAELTKMMMNEMMLSLVSLGLFLILLRLFKASIVIIAPFPLVWPFTFMGKIIYSSELNSEVIGFHIVWWYFLAAFPVSYIQTNVQRFMRIKKKLQKYSKRGG